MLLFIDKLEYNLNNYILKIIINKKKKKNQYMP